MYSVSELFREGTALIGNTQGNHGYIIKAPQYDQCSKGLRLDFCFYFPLSPSP